MSLILTVNMYGLELTNEIQEWHSTGNLKF